jgi:hypothetical protein
VGHGRSRHHNRTVLAAFWRRRPRPGPQISQIAQAIIAQLARVNGTAITPRLGIDAGAPADCPSEVVGGVEANAKTLKFEQSEFS